MVYVCLHEYEITHYLRRGQRKRQIAALHYMFVSFRTAFRRPGAGEAPV